MRVLPTKWRRKPAGIDMERNYVTVTQCLHGAANSRPIQTLQPSAIFNGSCLIPKLSGTIITTGLVCDRRWFHFCLLHTPYLDKFYMTLTVRNIAEKQHPFEFRTSDTKVKTIPEFG